MTGSAHPDRDLKDRLLLATLPHVVFDGWSRRALAAGAADLGLAGETLAEIFPGGVRDLAIHFNDWADRAMLAAADAASLDRLSVREKIAGLVRLRLVALAPYREAVRKAVAHMALPGNGGAAAKSAYRTVDAIWYAAGDAATDFNFYTKRGLLLAVYTATVLYWLADESEGFAESWRFLDRRIADVMTIPRLQGRLRAAADRLPSPRRLLRPLRAR